MGRERGAEVESRQRQREREREREREMLDQSDIKKCARLDPASGKLAVV
jgi:hypothetical protein